MPPDDSGVSEGFATLSEILKLAPFTKVVVITGHGDQGNAVKAVGLGAYDFYQKPVDVDTLQLIVQRAYQIHALEAENRQLAESLAASPLDGVIAASDAMLKVCRTIEKVAPTNATTLLQGESGTGKEVLARAIHTLSNRRGEPFVAINCAAIPDTLLESELFGFEKGAFTGAVKQTPGKIEIADGGTLFLDEIGDMPGSLQAKLLRFLQQRTIERIGGRAEIPVDVRVVCATNKNLRQAMATGAFREDLYYRISEITIEIPPLREREGGRLLLAPIPTQQVLQAARARDQGLHRGRPRRDRDLRLARQRPRDGEQDQGCGHHGRGQVRDGRGSRLERDGEPAELELARRAPERRDACDSPGAGARGRQYLAHRGAARRDPADALRPHGQVWDSRRRGRAAGSGRAGCSDGPTLTLCQRRRCGRPK